MDLHIDFKPTVWKASTGRFVYYIGSERRSDIDSHFRVSRTGMRQDGEQGGRPIMVKYTVYCMPDGTWKELKGFDVLMKPKGFRSFNKAQKAVQKDAKSMGCPTCGQSCK